MAISRLFRGSRSVAFAFTLLLGAASCSSGGRTWGAETEAIRPVPMIHATDLFRPHNDPDDHWDLACVYALAARNLVDLRAVMIDYPQPERGNDPDVLAVAQMNHLTGLAAPIMVGSPRWIEESEFESTEAATDLRGYSCDARHSSRLARAGGHQHSGLLPRCGPGGSARTGTVSHEVPRHLSQRRQRNSRPGKGRSPGVERSPRPTQLQDDLRASVSRLLDAVFRGGGAPSGREIRHVLSISPRRHLAPSSTPACSDFLRTHSSTVASSRRNSPRTSGRIGCVTCTPSPIPA